ncbi:MAG: T9SS type A sorting domain-containing protein, partial [Bacteroidota bacterium]
DYDQIRVEVDPGLTNPSMTCPPGPWYPGDTLFFSDNTGNSVEWGWDFGDGSTLCPITPDVWHVYAQPGNYTVQMYIGNGVCYDTVTCSVDILTGLEDPQAANDLQLFPNPTEGQTQIRWEHDYRGQVQLQIRNMLGQVVEQVRMEKNAQMMEAQIELDGVSSGLYFVELKGENVQRTKKLLLK